MENHRSELQKYENQRQELQVPDYELGPQQEINLRDYWEKLRRRKGTVLSVTAGIVVLAAFWTFIQRPVYTAKGTLLIEKEPNILSFEQVLQIETMRDDFYQTQYRLLSGRTLAEDVVNRLKLVENEEFVGKPEKRKKPIDPTDHIFRENLIDGFLGRLDVRPVRLTRLVEVSFRARNPKLAADCVNELSSAFIDLNINMKYAATEQATQFLTDQIKGLQTDIEQKENQLQGLEAEANIVALSDKETTVIDRLGSINKALTEAQIERSNKEAVWNGLKNVGPDYIPAGIENPLVQKLREDYVKLKREYEKMEIRFRPDFPELQRAKSEMESARQALDDETQNLVKGAYQDYLTALNKERSLEAVFNGQKDAAFKMNSSAVLYNGLKIEIQNKKNLLDSLLRRQSETGVEARLKGLRTSNVRVVDRARVPVRPSSPNKRRNLLLALILGLGGGVGLAFLFDFLDNSVKTSEDVERYAGLPTLGVVPKFTLEGTAKGYLYGGGRRRRKEERRALAEAGERKKPKKDAPGRRESEARGEARGGRIGRALESEKRTILLTSKKSEKKLRKERERARVARGDVFDLSRGSAGEEAAGRTGSEGYDHGASAAGAAEGYGHGAGERESASAAYAAEGNAAAASFGTGEKVDRIAPEDAAARPHAPEPPRAIELVPHFFPNSRLAESYRSIRTALLLSSADQPVKTIAVTSALPGEGKTVSVANLGVTLAQSGKTVLIVDADLRRPRQHRLFKVKNTFGLTTYLTDSVELRNVVKATEIPNLFLVNAGPIPPNPAELLGSERMAKFVRMMREECDYVLFDLPPMLDISDALVLGAKLDGMVLVVWGDKTSREALRKAREKLDMLKIRTLGVVINNVKTPISGHYYKDYYYHYGQR